MNLVEAVLAGERLALARVITQVENDTPQGRQALDALFCHTGQAVLIGVTGAPGTGKSSLVNQLARQYRHPADGSQPRKVAIVAIDPTSPFTGGAVLGDRVRMRDLAGDPGVFIRSMASRGALGGLARSTAEVVQVLDAAGFEVILIETVGVGQDEVDIARLAHTTLVVEAPGLGDDIQAIKAGILEIADILVVNKADHPGAEQTERALKAMLEWGEGHRQNGMASSQHETWIPPVLKTVATQGTGITELSATIERHFVFLRNSGLWVKREEERLKAALDLLVQETLVARWRDRVNPEMVQELLEAVQKRSISPFQAVERLLK